MFAILVIDRDSFFSVKQFKISKALFTASTPITIFIRFHNYSIK